MIQKRVVTEVLIFKLVLNPITDRTESARLVAWSDEKQKLVDWYNSLKVEPYRDNNWYKTFLSGSPLEWYNGLIDLESISYLGHGIHEEWVEESILENINIARI